MRVLIVDDCELSAGMLAVVLEIYGHKVQQTGSLASALRTAVDFRPETVLMAVSVPVSSAELNAAEMLRGMTDVEPQIFALCSTPGELTAGERAGFARVFPRPVRFGQLKPYLDSPLPVLRHCEPPVPRAYAHTD